MNCGAMVAAIVRVRLASEPELKTILAVPAPTAVMVASVPLRLTVATAGLLETALNVSSVPLAASAVTLTDSGASPASAAYVVAPGLSVSCTGFKLASPMRTSSIWNDLLVVYRPTRPRAVNALSVTEPRLAPSRYTVSVVPIISKRTV